MPLLRDIIHSPLRDLLRGRVTGANDPRRIPLERGIPEPLARQIVRIVNRTWFFLLVKERREALRELSERVAADLRAGATPDEIAERLKPARKESRRIRREMVGRRSVFKRWSLRAPLIFLIAIPAVWLGLYLRFHSGEVVIAEDYAAKLNATAAAAAPDERAWPHLREAILDLRESLSPLLRDDPFRAAMPELDPWPETVASLEQSQDALDRIRRAAAMPHLGYVISDTISEADRELWPEKYAESEARRDKIDSVRLLSFMDFNHTGELRRLRSVLYADAICAALAGDGETAVGNVAAILDLARLTTEIPTLINQLVAISNRSAAFSLVGELINRAPEAFTREQLDRLASDLRAVNNNDIRITYDAERWLMLDMIQRSYTDDGTGGGHLVGPQFEYKPGAGHRYTQWGGSAMMYVWSVISPGRRAVERYIDQLFDAAEDQSDTPLWERDDSSVERDVKVDALSWRWEFPWSFLFMDLFIPAIERPTINAELLILQRDAAITVVALERFRRDTGAWPVALEQLVPAYLAELPIDRFTGEPLRYTNRSPDKPLLYSVGADLDDDGGRPELDEDGWPVNAGAGRWIAPEKAEQIRAGTYPDDRPEHSRKLWPLEDMLPPDADYILWPPLPENLDRIREHEALDAQPVGGPTGAAPSRAAPAA